MNALDWALRSVRDAPRGPQVGAFFDLDGTLVEGYTAAAFIRHLLMRGEISPDDFLQLVQAGIVHKMSPDSGQDFIKVGAQLMEGWDEAELLERAQTIFKKSTAASIRPGARELLQAHRDAGHTLVMASAATPFQAIPIAEDLGIPHLLTTQVEVKDGKLTGQLDGPPLWGIEKARAVQRFAQEHGIDLEASFGYGNGYEDHLFLSTVGHPVAVQPDKNLTAIARAEHIPTLPLQNPPKAGLRGALGTLGAFGAFNVGLMTTLAASLVVDKSAAFRVGFPNTANAMLAAAGVQLEVQGQEHIDPTKPAIYIFNHQSNLDPFIVASIARRKLIGVGKMELATDFRGAFLRFLDIAFIDRSNPEQARASVAALADRIRAGESVLIAPEGTRMPTPKLGRFKRGAFYLAYDARVPLIPIVLRNTGTLWPRGTPLIASGVVEVCVLPPISTQEWSRDTIGAHADDTRAMFAQVLERWPSSTPRAR
ncbi:MAG: HAD-IB family hydrolase [Myxococcota bacterium]